MAQIGLNLNYGAKVEVSWSAEVPDCMGIFIACDSMPGHPLARDTVHLYGTPEAMRALADKMRAALPAVDQKHEYRCAECKFRWLGDAVRTDCPSCDCVLTERVA